MATFSRRGNSWRVEVRKQGTRNSATFRTKAQATAWAVKAEAELYNGVNTNKISRVGAAFLFAIETGMRAGEIAGLRPEHIDLKQQVAHLHWVPKIGAC